MEEFLPPHSLIESLTNAIFITSRTGSRAKGLFSKICDADLFYLYEIEKPYLTFSKLMADL